MSRDVPDTNGPKKNLLSSRRQNKIVAIKAFGIAKGVHEAFLRSFISTAGECRFVREYVTALFNVYLKRYFFCRILQMRIKYTLILSW